MKPLEPMDPVQIAEDTVREAYAAVSAEVAALQMLQKVAPSREVALAITNWQQGLHWLKEAGHGSWLDAPDMGAEEKE